MKRIEARSFEAVHTSRLLVNKNKVRYKREDIVMEPKK